MTFVTQFWLLEARLQFSLQVLKSVFNDISGEVITASKSTIGLIIGIGACSGIDLSKTEMIYNPRFNVPLAMLLN